MDVSPFASLPAELRNRIFRFALQEDHGIGLKDGEPALTRTCRQIRNENVQVFRAVNNFALKINPGAGVHIARNLEDLDKKKLSLIPVLTVHSEAELEPRYGLVMTINEWDWELVVDALATKGLPETKVNCVVFPAPNAPRYLALGRTKEERAAQLQARVRWLWHCAAMTPCLEEPPAHCK